MERTAIPQRLPSGTAAQGRGAHSPLLHLAPLPTGKLPHSMRAQITLSRSHAIPSHPLLQGPHTDRMYTTLLSPATSFSLILITPPPPPPLPAPPSSPPSQPSHRQPPPAPSLISVSIRCGLLSSAMRPRAPCTTFLDTMTSSGSRR